MKKRLIGLSVLLLLVFGLSTGLFAQDLVPKSGDHLTISLKAENWAVFNPPEAIKVASASP